MFFAYCLTVKFKSGNLLSFYSYGKVYGGIHHNYDKTVILSADELFNAKEGLDYFDNICN